MTTNVTPLASHPRTRENSAAHAAELIADRLALAPKPRADLIAGTRGLVRAGCSAAWAIRVARRTARRSAMHPERA